MENLLTEEKHYGDVITPREMHKISLKIGAEDSIYLARELHISMQTLKQIEVNCVFNQFGAGDIIYEILQEWKNKNGNAATKAVIKNALLDMGRQDVVEEVFASKKDGCVTAEEMNKISMKIERKDYSLLSRELELKKTEMDEIMHRCTIDHLSDNEIVFRILNRWKQKKGKEAKRVVLKNVLETIGRKDVAEEVFPETSAKMTESSFEIREPFSSQTMSGVYSLIGI